MWGKEMGKRLAEDHRYCLEVYCFTEEYSFYIGTASTLTHATIEVYRFLAKWLLNDGAPYPKKRWNQAFFFNDSRCVPRPWDFSSGSSTFIFLQIGFWERS